MIVIEPATFPCHNKIVVVAKQYKYTSAFGHIMFSSEEHYKRGWITAAWQEGKIVGFICLRHKVRQPETNVYFLAVDKEHAGQGIGGKILQSIIRSSPYKDVVLKVANDNTHAYKFYLRHKFKVEKQDGKYWYMRHVRK